MSHILFISPQPFFQWRGTPIRVRFVVKGLAKSGHRIDLLTLPFGQDEQIDNVRIIRIANFLGVRDIAIGPSLAKLFFDMILFFKAIVLIYRHHYDVIHGIEEGGVLAVLLAKIFRIRSVYEKHSDPFSYRKGVIRNFCLFLYASIETLVVKHADLIICTGLGLSEQVRRSGTLRPVHTIYDMPSSTVQATAEKTAKIAQHLRQQADEVLVTFVGSFAIYQGVDVMFDAIPHANKSSSRVRFVIIGGSKEEIKQRKSRLKQQGLEEKVTFLGIIPPDELPDYLSASNILLVPRQSGVNTPLKVLDYFKAGGAIVATDVPSNRIILNENTALFASPDAASFAEQILRLVRDTELCKRLGTNGRELYEQKYNFVAFQKRLDTAYAELAPQD